MSMEGKVKFYDETNDFGKITSSVEGVAIFKFRKSDINERGYGQEVPQVGDVVTYDKAQGRAINVSLKVLPPLIKSDHIRIGEAAISYAKEVSVDAHEAKEASDLRTCVEKLIRGLSKYPSAKVFMLGSHVQGLATRDSDLDFAVDPQGKGTWVTMGEAVDTVRELHGDLKPALGAFVVSATVKEGLRFISARVPIVTFNARQGIKWDLSVERNGVRSSRWLRIFFERDPNLRVAAMWSKKWGKEEGVIDKFTGLCSYAVDMLFVHYAVKSKEAKDQDPAKVDMSQADGCPDFLGRAGDGADAEKVGKLIDGFFKFYRLFNFTKDVVTLKKKPAKRTTKQDLGWTKDYFERLQPKAKNLYICIQDVYDENENLGGKLYEDRARQLREAFYRGALELRQHDEGPGNP